jgi:hypothetical protein
MAVAAGHATCSSNMDAMTSAYRCGVWKSLQLEAKEERKQGKASGKSDAAEACSGCRTSGASHEVKATVSVLLLMSMPCSLRSLPRRPVRNVHRWHSLSARIHAPDFVLAIQRHHLLVLHTRLAHGTLLTDAQSEFEKLSQAPTGFSEFFQKLASTKVSLRGQVFSDLEPKTNPQSAGH